jgi:hypothetical protein
MAQYAAPDLIDVPAFAMAALNACDLHLLTLKVKSAPNNSPEPHQED